MTIGFPLARAAIPILPCWSSLYVLPAFFDNQSAYAFASFQVTQATGWFPALMYRSREDRFFVSAM